MQKFNLEDLKVMRCHLANLGNENLSKNNFPSTVSVAQGGLYIDEISFTSFSYNDLSAFRNALIEAVTKDKTINMEKVTPILQTQYNAHRRKFSDMDILKYIDKILPQYERKSN